MFTLIENKELELKILTSELFKNLDADEFFTIDIRTKLTNDLTTDGIGFHNFYSKEELFNKKGYSEFVELIKENKNILADNNKENKNVLVFIEYAEQYESSYYLFMII